MGAGFEFPIGYGVFFIIPTYIWGYKVMHHTENMYPLTFNDIKYESLSKIDVYVLQYIDGDIRVNIS